jgi:multiple sugar transport system permease protein
VARRGALAVARRQERRALLALRGLVLFAFAVFFGGPLVWLLLAPTKTGAGFLTGSVLAPGDIHHVWAAWRELDAFDGHAFRHWLGNSLVYTSGAVALTLATAIPAGFGLAFGRFPGRRAVLAVTLVAMVMPPTALVLPIFLELNAAHLIGSAFSVILPLAFFPFGVYLAYLYYATVIPAGLLDAARIDGCSDWQTFRRVVLPLSKPLVAYVLFFAFVADWTNFYLPYVVLADSSQFPIQVGLMDILQGSGPEVALAALIAATPVAIVFTLSQRALVRGLVDGASVG